LGTAARTLRDATGVYDDLKGKVDELSAAFEAGKPEK
jgi:hypothetical protein